MSTVLTAAPTASGALARLERHLDLTNVRMKLADPKEGKGCTPEQLDVMEAEYRRFLAMHLAYPDAEVVPCHLVDEIWHAHILDTIAYRRDCEELLGGFLDHYPYFGMRSEVEAQELGDAYADTLEIYEREFGTPPAGTWIAADAANCKRKNCKPQQCSSKPKK
jgi:hypothetical protein